MKPSRRSRAVIAAIAAIAATAAGLLAASGAFATAANASATFIGGLRHTKVIASTVPANGDVNPYGVAVVPRSTGDLYRGNVLVSNFNDKANVRAGTAIVQVSRAVRRPLRQCHRQGLPGGVGLTTALVALRSGQQPPAPLLTSPGKPSLLLRPSCTRARRPSCLVEEARHRLMPSCVGEDGRVGRHDQERAPEESRSMSPQRPRMRPEAKVDDARRLPRCSMSSRLMMTGTPWR